MFGHVSPLLEKLKLLNFFITVTSFCLEDVRSWSENFSIPSHSVSLAVLFVPYHSCNTQVFSLGVHSPFTVLSTFDSLMQSNCILPPQFCLAKSYVFFQTLFFFSFKRYDCLDSVSSGGSLCHKSWLYLFIHVCSHALYGNSGWDVSVSLGKQ